MYQERIEKPSVLNRMLILTTISRDRITTARTPAGRLLCFACVFFVFLAHSNELIQSRGVRHVSVCPSISKRLSQLVDEFKQRRRTPSPRQNWPNAGLGRACYFTQNISSSAQMAGLWSNLHMMVSRWASSRVCSGSRSRCKVTWYQHIWNFAIKKSVTQSLLPFPIRFGTRMHIDNFWKKTDK